MKIANEEKVVSPQLTRSSHHIMMIVLSDCNPDQQQSNIILCVLLKDCPHSAWQSALFQQSVAMRKGSSQIVSQVSQLTAIAVSLGT